MGTSSSLHSQGFAKRYGRFHVAVANSFVKNVSILAGDIRPQIYCPTSLLASPLLSLLHQQPSNATAAMAFVCNKSSDFCEPIRYHQFSNMDMNPANHMSVRQFCNINGVLFILLNLVETSLHLFPRCRVA